MGKNEKQGEESELESAAEGATAHNAGDGKGVARNGDVVAGEHFVGPAHEFAPLVVAQGVRSRLLGGNEAEIFAG